MNGEGPTDASGRSSIVRDLAVLETACGVALRPEIRTLRLAGPDRVRFLNGMVTADVSALAEGQGVWAVKTNNKGRVEAMLRVRAAADALLLDVRAVVAQSLHETLNKFIIMDDCQITDASADRQVIAVLGPTAKETLLAAGIGPVPDDLEENGFVKRGAVEIIRDRSLGLLGYEVHVPEASAVAQLDTLLTRGARGVSAEALDVARVEAGIPIDGKDLDAETLPMEAGLDFAINADKGCYVGQEVIARANLQGHVNHALVGLRFAAPPAEGAELIDPSDSKRIGEVTSIAYSPHLDAWIALGFVRTSHRAPGTKLTTRGPHEGAAAHPVEVVALPFARVP